MCASESRQIDERFHTGVISAENGRFQQTRRSISNAVQQFLKSCHGGRIRREPCVRAADGAVYLLFVIPNGTFRPRHELLLLLPELELLNRWRASAAKSGASKRTTTIRSRPAHVQSRAR